MKIRTITPTIGRGVTHDAFTFPENRFFWGGGGGGYRHVPKHTELLYELLFSGQGAV